MRSTIRFIFVVVAAWVALVASVFTAFATSSAPARPGDPSSAQPGPGPFGELASSAGCAQMQASGIAWVTLTPDHHIDQQVSSYASGSSRITPVFRYNCAPDNTTIVSIFSLNGLTVFTDKETIPARTIASLYGYALETIDSTPLSDGQWDVQYFNDKTPLSGGSVTIGNTGGDPSQTTSATVQGVVQDKDSQSPIEGAVILVLNPGVQLEDFIKNGEQTTDVFTVGKSDSQGSFALAKKLQRHQVYEMIVNAAGYKPVGNTSFQVNDEPDPVSITVSMTK